MKNKNSTLTTPHRVGFGGLHRCAGTDGEEGNNGDPEVDGHAMDDVYYTEGEAVEDVGDSHGVDAGGDEGGGMVEEGADEDNDGGGVGGRERKRGGDVNIGGGGSAVGAGKGNGGAESEGRGGVVGERGCWPRWEWGQGEDERGEGG
uniref:Glycine-rich cell wall structural protein 1.0-like n=1 Tax=Elaeis guineensis var. tenera TaxID=51953 RepID=A0A6I9SIK2_ELAGV|nr:glycine-rich cell wall structural protein 1.0-like [Elaeis guineensis]